jgi:hypothetical protein
MVLLALPSAEAMVAPLCRVGGELGDPVAGSA